MGTFLRGDFFIIFIIISFFAMGRIFGVSSEIWEQKGYSEFSKGTLHRLSITEEGYLILSPPFKKIAEVPEEVIWMIAEDDQGSIYAATGHEGKIYRISNEELTLFFDADEIEVQSIILGPHHMIYAATSPDGKVYKIDKTGKSSVFYDPEDKYIWDLAFGKDGNLYIATGEKGHIYKVSKEGASQLFYKSHVPHVRVLAFDDQNRLIAGTAGEGLIIRIDSNGKGFVLFDSSRQEISSLAISKDGIIYAAAVGEKSYGKDQKKSKFSAEMSKAIVLVKESQSKKKKKTGMSLPEEGKEAIISSAGSEIIKIDRSGFPKKIWESSKEVVHSLLIDKEGNLLIGTGNEGIIYRIDKEEKVSMLIKMDDHQVTHMISSADKIFMGSASNATLSCMGQNFSTEGEYISQVKDTSSFSTWGIFKSLYEVPLGSAISFFTRSGNKRDPDETWSPWAKLKMKDNSGPIVSPKARFIQWKARLRWHDHAQGSPVVKYSAINYLPENEAPEITLIEIQKPGLFFQKLPMPQMTGTEISKTTNRTKTKVEKSLNLIKMKPPIKKVYQYGKRTVSWEASDPNGDELIFTIDFKGVEEKRWKTLQKDIMEHFYSWDSRLMADGYYLIKIIASDSPSNPETLTKKSEKTSEPFIIDNTPPVIFSLKRTRDKGKVIISFSVKDNISHIENVEYSLNAQDWKIIFPDDQVYDSSKEFFHIELPTLEKVEESLVVKAMDESGNIGSAKVILSGE